MFKKVLLIGAAFLAMAGFSYAYDITNLIHRDVPSIKYGATKANDKEKGTTSINMRVTNGTFDKNLALFEADVTIDTIVTNNVQSYIITPTSVDNTCTNLDFKSWSIENPSSSNYFDWNDESYCIEDFDLTEYSKIMSIYKNSTQPVSIRGGGKYYYAVGKDIKKTYGVSNTIDGYNELIQDDHWYYYEEDRSGKLTYVTVVYTVSPKTKGKTSRNNCWIQYDIEEIPAGIINANIKSLSIPATVKSINANAFANASNLTKISSEVTKYDVVDNYGDNNCYLYEVISGKKSLLFASKTEANVKPHEINLENSVTSIKTGALKYHYNLTMWSNTIAAWSKADANGNIVRNNNNGAKVLEDATISTDYGTAKYMKVGGNISQSEFNNIVNQASGYQYVEFVSSAVITENIKLDDATAAAHNTIYFFANLSGKTVTGKNMVVGTNGGTCATFVLDQVDDLFYNPYAFTATTAKINRAIGANYSTIALPFNVTSDWSNLFRICGLDEFDAATNEFTFQVSENVSANVPYIIKAKSGTSTTLPIVKGVSVAATPSSISKTVTTNPDASFIAAFNTEYLKDRGSVYCYGLSNNKVMKANNTKCQTFRAYLTGPAASYSAATARVVDFDNNTLEFFEAEETGIDAIINNETENTIFNVNGSRADNTNNSGIYVVNGKKVIIK